MRLESLIHANNKSVSKVLKSSTQENSYFDKFYDEFVDIALSMFEWKGLPDSASGRYLEEVLFMNGQAVFYYDETIGGLLTLKGASSSEVDIYGRPKSFIVHGEGNNYRKEIKYDDLVLVRNNAISKPSYEKIFYECVRLANIAMTIDINVNAQKTPILLLTDELNEMTARNIYKNYSGGAPVIFLKKEHYTNVNDVLDVVKTDAPFVANELIQLQHDLKNDVLTSLGINNTDQHKKERLVKNEADSNLDEIFIKALSMYDERKKACKKVNDKFGTNIDVVFKKDKYRELMDIFQMGVYNEDDEDEVDTTPFWERDGE